MGKNHCKQVINIFLLINHTVLELACLKRRSIVDSPQLPPTGALKSLEGPYRAESWSVVCGDECKRQPKMRLTWLAAQPGALVLVSDER